MSEYVKYSTESLLTFRRPEDPPPKRRLGLCWEWNSSKQYIVSKQRIITRVIIDTIVSCGVDPALWLKSVLREVETSKRDKVSPNIRIIEGTSALVEKSKKSNKTSVFRLSLREDSDGCKTTVLWCRSGWEDWLTRTAYFSARENVLLWEGYDLIWPALVSALLSVAVSSSSQQSLPAVNERWEKCTYSAKKSQRNR